MTFRIWITFSATVYEMVAKPAVVRQQPQACAALTASLGGTKIRKDNIASPSDAQQRTLGV